MTAIRKSRCSNKIKTSLFDKDIWSAEELGMEPNGIHGMYYLKFGTIKPKWLKDVMKQFVYYQSTTRSFSTCYSYISRLKELSRFLKAYKRRISAKDMNRKVMIDYLTHLSRLPVSATTKNMCIIHLKTLHRVAVQEKWLPWSNEPLVFPSDFIKKPEHIPKYIPESVIAQLLKHAHHLSKYIQHFVIISLETGRRLSEICMMPYDCLSKDEQRDYFLKVNDTKMKKSYLIPISEQCVVAIKSQQDLIKSEGYNGKLLFPARKRVGSPYISGRHINKVLNDLAEEYNILDDDGKLWKFHTHQFRHTVGTRMINTNVPQTIVQKYLGHKSPEMTSKYAHIHNSTLKKEFNKYQDSFIDIYGKTTKFKTHKKINDAKWLKHNIMAQALPNGLCGLPASQQGCPHANACLTCVNFKTSKKFLSQHKQQLCDTKKIIDQAKKNGWDRQYEMNIKVKNNLEVIIKSLDKDNKK